MPNALVGALPMSPYVMQLSAWFAIAAFGLVLSVTLERFFGPRG
jgi:hypothetical protein